MHLNELIRVRNLRVEPHHSSLSLVDTPAHHALQTSSSCWICCSNSSARVASILDTEAPWGCKNNLTSIALRMMKHVIFVIIKYLGPSKIDPWKNTRNGYMKWSSTHRPKSVPEAEPPCMVCCTVLGTLPLRFEVRAVAWHHSCGVWCDVPLQKTRKFEGTYEIWRKMTKNIFNQKKTISQSFLWLRLKQFSCAWFNVNAFHNFQLNLPKSHRNNLATRHADEHDARVAPHITTGMPFLLMSVSWASPVVFISGGMLSLPFEAQCGTLHPGVCCVCFAKCKF